MRCASVVVFCLYVLVCTFLYFVYMYWYVRFILFLIVHRVLVLSTCMYSHCIILCLLFMPSHFLFVYYIDDHLSDNELYCFTQDSDWIFFYTKTLSCRLFKNCVFISPIKFTSFLQTRCYVLTISCMSTLAIVMLCFM